MYRPNYHISNDLLNIIAQIESVRSAISLSYILPEREVEMRYRATVEATHSSTSIEGNPLNRKQVELALSEKPSLTRHRYAEIEVRNYKKAIDHIEKRATSMERMTAEDILTVHRIMTAGLLDESRTGHWRKNPVYIEDQDGRTVYDAADTEDVEGEVEELLAWLNTSSYEIHPVIAAAIFHVQFVSIHPFADGNGRTTRALTMLYLSLRSYDFRNALVLDSYYAMDKKAYYEALHTVQGNNYETAREANLDPWIDYFADGFLVSANVLAAEVSLLASAVRTASIDQRVSREELDILSYVRQFGSISISEAEGIFRDVSRRTIQRRLKRLVDAGYIQQDGATHDARYIAG
ncbi:MAG: Fic family protein [Coriobacteriales bacterium]|jgi:Fic family protein|nr:Fic family protein [Coriobacteriales bacterium]